MQYKWTVLTVTTVGVLMSGIDGRIVIVGLPTVAAALHADAEQAIWFTQAYVIGSTVALLFIGRVSDMFGRVKVYSIGFTIFTIGSFLTASSGDPNTFIAARIFQGLGSAALFANSAAIIADAFPSNQLGTALGINQIAFRAGGVGGLTLSGLILAVLDWRFLFYINIPVGIFGTLWAYWRLHEVGKRERTVPMDWPGFISFTVFITSLLLSLTFAAYGAVDFSVVIGLGVLATASLVAFVHIENRTEHPLLDLSLLRIREFTGGCLAQMINSVAWGAFLLVISLYLQLVQGLSPLQAGVAMLPFDFGFLVAGPLSGHFSDKYGPLPFTTAGLIVISTSLFLFSEVAVNTPYLNIAMLLVLGGLGTGLFASPNMSSIMGSVPAKRRAVASALRATFFNVGYTLSVNAVILLMTLKVPYSLISNMISSINPTNVTPSQKAAFAGALNFVYLILFVINLSAFIPSLLRGKRVQPRADAESSDAGASSIAVE
ncbi:MAG: MFS transporter [Nitrososphaerales archaeon]|jgi:EmrB/QacA subfamily drug resistance transporter